MKKVISTIVFSIIIGSLIITCKPSTKGEIQQWENNNKEFAEAVAKYSAFKTVLNAKKAEAQKIWDEAAKIAKEEEKAEKMKAANDKLNELLNLFTQIKYKSQGINDAIIKLNKLRLTKLEEYKRTSAKKRARETLAEVNASLADAKVTGEAEAKVITDEQISKLISAKSDIDSAIRSLKPAKKKSSFKKNK